VCIAKSWICVLISWQPLIQKWTDFNGNGYLQGVRNAAPYDDHFGLLWWPFEPKMAY
jgi:hypothetical protein